MIFVIVLIIGSCIVFWIHGRFEAVRTHHLEKRLRWIHNHNTNNDNMLLDDNEEDETNKNPGASTTELTTKESVIEIEASSDKQGDADGAENQTNKKKKWNKVSQTFDIEFEHLGLTLSNGTPILQVGQRQIHENEGENLREFLSNNSFHVGHIGCVRCTEKRKDMRHYGSLRLWENHPHLHADLENTQG